MATRLRARLNRLVSPNSQASERRTGRVSPPARFSPAPTSSLPTPDTVLALQKTHGNAFVQRLLRQTSPTADVQRGRRKTKQKRRKRRPKISPPQGLQPGTKVTFAATKAWSVSSRYPVAIPEGTEGIFKRMVKPDTALVDIVTQNGHLEWVAPKVHVAVSALTPRAPTSTTEEVSPPPQPTDTDQPPSETDEAPKETEPTTFDFGDLDKALAEMNESLTSLSQLEVGTTTPPTSSKSVESDDPWDQLLLQMNSFVQSTTPSSTSTLPSGLGEQEEDPIAQLLAIANGPTPKKPTTNKQADLETDLAFMSAFGHEVIGGYISAKFVNTQAQGSIFMLDDEEFIKKHVDCQIQLNPSLSSKRKLLEQQLRAKQGIKGEEENGFRWQDKIYIRQGKDSKGTRIHEMVHRYSHADFRETLGWLFNEAATDYFTVMVDPSVAGDLTYGSLVQVLKEMMNCYGINEQELAAAYFAGQVGTLQTKIDGKQPGFFARLCDASHNKAVTPWFYLCNGIDPNEVDTSSQEEVTPPPEHPKLQEEFKF